MMKTFFKFLCVFIFVTMIVSCETGLEDVIEENEIELIDINNDSEKLVNNTDCTRIQGELGDVCFTGDRVYSVIHPFGNGAQIRWSIPSGVGISIIGSSTNSTVTVRFSSQFQGGELQVIVGNCISILELGVCSGGIECPPNVAPLRPGPITFDIFLGSRPNNGDFCVNTVANALWVSNVDCAVDYIWTISPSVFGTQLRKTIHPATALLEVSQAGEYVVSVRAVGSNGQVSNARSIMLTAENCGGGGFGGF